LTDRPETAAHAPIDLFFRTLAETHAADAVGIVLSGTGSDGTSGLRRIKEAGGITIAQAPEDAEYDGMPRSAIETGRVDLVLRAREMPAELLRIVHSEPRLRLPADDAEEEEEGEGEEERKSPALRQIFGRLRARTGHDFSLYKRATVLRRLDRRMRFAGIDALPEYVSLLRENPEELDELFRDLLISVSSFFRDPAAFEALERAIPGMFEGRGAGDRVRAWVAGCSTGEEVYSLAILLCEHAATLDEAPAIQIFATDIDEAACTKARGGVYAGTIAADVSAERLERFFIEEQDGYTVKKGLRDLVLFTGHDLLRDPPFHQLDLISCRNLLIYLMPEAQVRVLETFHYALAPGGLLFLGTAESPAGDAALFLPLDKRQRLYRRAPLEHGPIPRLLRPTGVRHHQAEAEALAGDRPVAPFSYGALHLRLLEAYASPSVVVNDRHEILHLSERAGRYLRLAAGEPTSDLVALVPEELRLELRAALHVAFRQEHATHRDLRIEGDGGARTVGLSVCPFRDAGGGEAFALIVFDEISQDEDAEAQDAGRRPSGTGTSHHASADAAQELKRARIELQSVVQERETTIEELQASNEELQSINEEQRATTEELETSKEELQSVNEELSTVNQEHRGTIEELGQTNADLQNLIASTDIGTIFLDRELRIRRFTPSVSDLINVVPSDIGRPIAHLTHALRYEDLSADARSALDSLETVVRELETQDRQHWYALRASPYRAADDAIGGVVITLFDITSQKRAQERLLAAETRLRLALEISDLGDWELDLRTGRSPHHGERHDAIFGYGAPPGDWGWKSFVEHVLPDERAVVDQCLERALATGEALEFECRIRRSDGEVRWIWVRGHVILDTDGSPLRAAGVIGDITDRKTLEITLRGARTAAEDANLLKDRFLATLSHEFRTPLNAVLGYADLLLLGDPDEPARSHMQRISLSARHLSSMIDDILGFARMDAGREVVHFERLDARDIVSEAAGMAEPEAAAKQLDLKVELPDDAIDIETDRAKLRQILVNLAGNAIKYTDRGEVRIAAWLEADRVVFTVQDSGIGIAPEDVERVFERFWQVDQTLTRGRGGTGLGLAAVREFSHLLGGDVEVESTLGKGSTFTVWLPARKPGEAEATAGSEAEAAAGSEAEAEAGA
ncbi:MAG: CheR family methyltransferase, partial [Longimicrobiales bacterium]